MTAVDRTISSSVFTPEQNATLTRIQQNQKQPLPAVPNSSLKTAEGLKQNYVALVALAERNKQAQENLRELNDIKVSISTQAAAEKASLAAEKQRLAVIGAAAEQKRLAAQQKIAEGQKGVAEGQKKVAEAQMGKRGIALAQTFRLDPKNTNFRALAAEYNLDRYITVSEDNLTITNMDPLITYLTKYPATEICSLTAFKGIQDFAKLTAHIGSPNSAIKALYVSIALTDAEIKSLLSAYISRKGALKLSLTHPETQRKFVDALKSQKP